MDWFLYLALGMFTGGFLGASLSWLFWRQQTIKRELEKRLLLQELTKEKEALSLRLEELARERKDLLQKLEKAEETILQQQTALARLEEKLLREEERRLEVEREKDKLAQSLAQVSEALSQKEAELAKLRERLAQEESKLQEKLALLKQAQKELEDTFKALSAEILQSQSESFFKLAKERFFSFKEEVQAKLKDREEALERMTQPLKEALEKMKQEIKEMELKREGAYRGLEEALRNLVQVYLPKLQKETENLSQALRQPMVRGRWGEIQLRRVVEMAGLLPKCDFEEQATFVEGDQTLRPDMVIHLPGGRIIAVDAKVPFEAYVKALENEEEAPEKLQEYVNLLKKHIKTLAQKKYWKAIESRWKRSPEFVILFLPAEGLFSAAVKADPSLIEFGVEHKVLLATPLTLIALLKAVACSWQEYELTENAKEIAQLGKQLYERLRTLTEHFNELGGKLGQAVKAYNKTLASYESRVLNTARKFEDLRLIPPEKRLPELKQVSVLPADSQES